MYSKHHQSNINMEDILYFNRINEIGLPYFFAKTKLSPKLGSDIDSEGFINCGVARLEII